MYPYLWEIYQTFRINTAKLVQKWRRINKVRRHSIQQTNGSPLFFFRGKDLTASTVNNPWMKAATRWLADTWYTLIVRVLICWYIKSVMADVVTNDAEVLWWQRTAARPSPPGLFMPIYSASRIIWCTCTAANTGICTELSVINLTGIWIFRGGVAVMIKLLCVWMSGWYYALFPTNLPRICSRRSQRRINVTNSIGKLDVSFL